ncbi:hypothetical protein [Tenacibaculum sp. 190524A05c]|uniref:Uncharacterized protein n=1 Tax=Tenacibaculum platacis TaxID=3137852 RepID=A0ABM9P5Q3_9FLAO
MKKRVPNFSFKSYFPIFTFLVVAFLFSFSSFYSPKWNYDWRGIRKQVKDSILKFDYYGSISWDSTNQFGDRLQSYFTHRWILDNADPHELYHLLDYPDGTVKAIAYEGLMYNSSIKKYPLLKKVLNDTLSFVSYRTGCIGSGTMLSNYVISFVTNIDERAPTKINAPIIDLTKKEKEEILKLLDQRISREKYYKEEFYKTIR